MTEAAVLVPTPLLAAQNLMWSYHRGELTPSAYRAALVDLLWQARVALDWYAYRAIGAYYRRARAASLARAPRAQPAFVPPTVRPDPRPTMLALARPAVAQEDAPTAYLPVAPDLPAPPTSRKAVSVTEALWRNLVTQLADKVRCGDLIPLPMPNPTYNTPSGNVRAAVTSGYYRLSAQMTLIRDGEVLTLGCRMDITSGQWRTAYANLTAQDRALIDDYFDGRILSDVVFAAWENVARLLAVGVHVLDSKPHTPPARIVAPEPLDEDELVPLAQLAPKRRRIRPCA